MFFRPPEQITPIIVRFFAIDQISITLAGHSFSGFF